MIVELINEQYNLEYKIGGISELFGYPHLKILETKENKYILKYIDSEKKGFMEKLYYELSNIDVALIPIINIYGCYVTKIFDENFVIFEYITLWEKPPTIRWWIDTFSKIHSLSAFHQKQEIQIIKLVSDYEKMFNMAERYISKDIKNILECLMGTVSQEKKFEVTGVLNHGDPLISNLMKKEKDFKLIDFESARIFPKEYDLQRFLWGIAIGELHKKNIENKWNEFIKIYKKNRDIPDVDWLLLENLYVLDFVTTLCWLFIVSNDKKRIDYERQTKELSVFCLALKEGTVQEMLGCILKEGKGEKYELYERK